MQHKSIVIVGGGPIGLTTALFLARQGIAVTMLDDGNSKQNDGRVLALSYASVAMLTEINAWPEELATRINQVHISHSGLGVSNILAADVNLPSLGYTVKYAEICARLQEEASQYPNITHHTCKVVQVTPGKNFATIEYTQNSQNECLTTDLAILAEGGKVKIEGVEYTDFDYAQSAITAEIIASKEHANIAYERFDTTGASVLLPHGKNFVIVWSLPTEEAKAIVHENLLIERLNKLPFMKRFGKIKLAGKVFSFPLKLQVAKNRALDRIVLIGNSAQTLHPISAQGMNLALRDVMTLCNMLTDEKLIDRNEFNSATFGEYNQLRTKDAKFVIGFTHNLARFLEQQNPLVGHLRGIGIMALSNCKPLQNIIANSLIFGHY